MKRKEYNKSLLEKCIELLRSTNPSKIYEGVVLSAYVIEQSFKSELRKINPLLYFNDVKDNKKFRAAMEKLSKKEILAQKTITGKQCIAQMCGYKKKLQLHKANLDELFDMRNFILHSTDDFLFDKESAAETAVSALKVCGKYVSKYSEASSSRYNPLTSHEFAKLQEKHRNKRISDLKALLTKHRKFFEKLDQQEVSRKINTNLPKTDTYTWIDQTGKCPACGQLSLDKIGTVDFDWTPDGIAEYGGYCYLCRVCELELSEYDYEVEEASKKT